MTEQDQTAGDTAPPAAITFTGHLEDLAVYLETGSGEAADALRALFAESDAGKFDDHFSTAVPQGAVSLTTSCHLLAMSLRHRLEGLSAKHFYCNDPERYVRSNLLVQKILGFRRLTLGWPVYAFGAEALGQEMLYPLDQAPGSDPGKPLLSLDRPHEIPEYDPGSEIAVLVRETLLTMARLGGIEPVAHLPAPYSLAAEVVGQENLILALTNDPASVKEFLAQLVNRFLRPWCADLYATVPDVWLELSDASGSPMFVGPKNFLEVSVGPVLALSENTDWGKKVFVANYRGDTSKARRVGGSRRPQKKSPAATSFEELMEAKRVCCPWFVTRLEADMADIGTYADYCKAHDMRLYAGIGATRTDRNSIVNREAHVAALLADVEIRARAIQDVGQSVTNEFSQSWPGDIYLEDTNAESDLRLIAQIAGQLNETY